jgi:hypothetical protein
MKVLIADGHYVFDASAKTVTFTDYVTIYQSSILGIWNTTRGSTYVSLADPTKVVTVATNVATLAADTTGDDDLDKLLIYYDDPTYDIFGKPADVGVLGDNPGTLSAKMRGINTEIATLHTDLAAIATAIAVTNTDLATTLHGDLGTLNTDILATNTDLAALHTDIATTLHGDLTTLQGYVDGLEGILGTTAGAGVITDANGTIQQYLRGLIILALSGYAENLTKIAGTAIDVNSGVKSAGTQRMVIATDQPALTNPLDINIKQVAGGVAITGGVTGSQATGGNVAHGSANAGNPDFLGAEAISLGANPAAVSTGQRTKLYALLAGILWTINGHPNIITRRDNFTAAQTDTALVTVSAGTKIVLMGGQVRVGANCTVNPSYRLGLGTANTPTGAQCADSHPACPPGGGTGNGNAGQPIVIGADNEDLRFTCSMPTSGSIDVISTYFTIPS